MLSKLLCFLAYAFLVSALSQTEEDELKKLQGSLLEKTGFDATGLPTVEDAQEIFKQKCLREATQEAYEKADLAKDDLISCIQGLVDFEVIKKEIEDAKPTGDMDLVFKKYCRKSPQLKQCVSNFTDAIQPCLSEKERANTRIIVNITESLTNFVCFKEGDRIALFIAEGGPECLSEKQEAIGDCVNSTMSKYIPKETPTIDNIPELLLQAEQCDDIVKLQNCVVKELEKCSEPTPSNIAESLFKFIRQVTPCSNKATVSAREAQAPGPGRGPGPHNSASSVVISSFLLMLSIYLIH